MYGSTRSSVSGLTFERALFSGYLGDGGLVVPEYLPTVDLETLKKWSSLSYVDLTKKILPLFIPDSEINGATLQSMCDNIAFFGSFMNIIITDDSER
jgi:threonine synthase